MTYTPEEGIKEVSIKETDYGIIDLLELPNAKMGIMTNRGIIIYDTQNNHAESILVNENHPDITTILSFTFKQWHTVDD